VAVEIGGIRRRSYATRLDIAQQMGKGTRRSHHVMTVTPQVVRLEFTSAFEMLDFVQVVSDHLSRIVGLDDDALHWVGVAIRESVINAIKHGNQNDAAKHVFVDFEARNGAAPELAIRVRDQGAGFDPSDLADPLAPENLLKSSGRGIFLIRNFMDDVQLRRAPEGGMEIRMVKRVQPATA
jgi:serine/threonine-protein kinase RsbW